MEISFSEFSLLPIKERTRYSEHYQEWDEPQRGSGIWKDISETKASYTANPIRKVYRKEDIEKPKESAQLTIGDTSFTKLADGFIQIVTKNGCVELMPDEIEQLAKFIK